MMYGRINRANLVPTLEDRIKLRQEAGVYSMNHRLFAAIRKAYLTDKITAKELMDLQAQIKAGNADGAERCLDVLVEGRY